MIKKILIALIPILIIIAFLIYADYWAFSSMSRLPKGDFICEKQSPDGTYTIKAYIVNGGATTAYSIRGELNYNKEKESPETIYWNYREEKAIIEWVDDNTVLINGHKLKIPDEKFDYRK